MFPGMLVHIWWNMWFFLLLGFFVIAFLVNIDAFFFKSILGLTSNCIILLCLCVFRSEKSLLCADLTSQRSHLLNSWKKTANRGKHSQTLSNIQWNGQSEKRAWFRVDNCKQQEDKAHNWQGGQWHSESSSETSGVVYFTCGPRHHTRRSGKVCKHSFPKNWSPLWKA